MKLAIAVEKGMVSGPGEAEEIRIYDTENSQQLESYPNPALTANSARGILMLKSIVDHGVSSVIVDGKIVNIYNSQMNATNHVKIAKEVLSKIGKDETNQ